MDDLISRQAAIDKADSLYRDTKNDECYMITGYNHAISDIRAILKSLPSAQPEQRWIPVSERMPRDGTWNIFTDGKNISVERYKADAFDHFFPNGRWFQLEDVIAWMPLPEPYKAERRTDEE